MENYRCVAAILQFMPYDEALEKVSREFILDGKRLVLSYRCVHCRNSFRSGSSLASKETRTFAAFFCNEVLPSTTNSRYTS